MADTPRIAIIGGGIAGLSAAYHLRRAAPDVEIVLLEAENRLGGKILTERVDGFVLEGGPDSFLASKPAGIELCRELGLEDRLQGTRPENRRTFVLHAGSLHELPEGLSGLVPSRLEPLLTSDLFSPQGKERMQRELDLPPRPTDGDESLAHFVKRRFGHEMYDRLVEPLMAGIYAGDGEQLSLAATFPQLRKIEQEHGSLIRGLQTTNPSGSAPRDPGRSGFLTPLGGMAEIVEALVPRLDGVRILTGRESQSLRRHQQDFTVLPKTGDSLSANAVILTTPAFAAAQLVTGLDAELAQALDSVPYVSTATVSLAYRLEDLPYPPHGYGYVVPRAEGRQVLACTWVSSKFAHRAPENHALFRLFVGRAGQEEAPAGSDADLLSLARDELQEVLHISAEPSIARVFRWPHAMPQYNLGHLDRLANIQRRLAQQKGLFLAGSAYRGVGIPDCIQSGRSAAIDALRSVRDLAEARQPDPSRSHVS